MAEITPVNRPNDEAEGLTGIPPRIHCAATPDTDEEMTEADRIIVDNFNRVIAELALAIAARQDGKRDEQD